MKKKKNILEIDHEAIEIELRYANWGIIIDAVKKSGNELLIASAIVAGAIDIQALTLKVDRRELFLSNKETFLEYIDQLIDRTGDKIWQKTK